MAIIEYFHEHAESITNIEQIKYVLYKNDGTAIDGGKPLLKLIYCEMEIDEKVYILDDGKWGHFNDRFYELLEEELSEIDSVVDFRDDFSIDYDSYEKGEFAGEGGYIEELSQDNDLVKLHKRNVSSSGINVEVADIYDKKRKELYTVKRGTDTSLSMYSFEQSLLSIQVLKNKKEFNVREELLKYNNRTEYTDAKKYPNIQGNLVDEIINSKNSAVLWLVDEKPKYIYEKVKSKSLMLKDFRSLMLKLKIVDWYTFTKDNNYNPKLYFAIDKPRKVKKEE